MNRIMDRFQSLFATRQPSQQIHMAVVLSSASLLLLFSTTPLWRMASAVAGRLYLYAVVATSPKIKKKSNQDEDAIKVSGLYIHPGKRYASLVIFLSFFPINNAVSSKFSCFSFLPSLMAHDAYIHISASQIISSRVGR